MLGWILGKVANLIDYHRLPTTQGHMDVIRDLDKEGSSITLQEGKSKITIKRDRFGVPHIYADTVDNVLFGQGFAMAQDRLWQLETTRRAAHGRLSEVVGPEALEIDQLMRTLGFTRIGQEDMEQITEESELRHMRSFINGINAYTQSQYYRRPVEFLLLGIQVERWKLVDCAAILRLLSFQLNRGFQVKIINVALRDALMKNVSTEENRRDLFEGLRFAFNDSKRPWRGDNDPKTATVLPKGVIEANEIDWERLKQVSDNLPPQNQGSNAFAISGELTTNGKPILASDPHLAISNPNVWYENHLVCRKEGLDCMGVTMVGAYGVSIGSSMFCSWGITLSYADMFDVYVEETKNETAQDSDGTQQWSCKFKDEWMPMQVVQETIKIKGKPDHVENVRIVPHHGPIITGILGSILGEKSTQKEFSLRATFMEPLKENKGKNVLDAFLGMNMAKSWNEWREYVKRLEPTTLSIVYADTDGNIGYQCSGCVPNRQHFVQGLKDRELHNLPLDGTSGEFEWNGHIPFEELPYTLNPERGYVVSCNNKLVDDDAYPYSHSLGNLYISGYRAERISSLIQQSIEEGKKMAAVDARNIQKDVLDLSAKELLDLVREDLLRFDDKHPLFKERMDVGFELAMAARDALLSWDMRFDVNSSGAAIFIVLKEHMLRNILGASFDSVNDKLMNMSLGAGSHQPIIVDTEYLQNHSAILAHMVMLAKNTSEDKTFIGRAGGLTTVLLRSLMDAVVRIRSLMGLSGRRWNAKSDEIARRWRWGKIHKAVWKHGFSDRIPAFTREGEMQGGSNTVCLGEYMPSTGNFNAFTVPSMRMVVDLGAITRESKIIIHPGNSGHLASPHYDDFVTPFLSGHYHPMYFEDDDIDQNCEGTLILTARRTATNLP